MICPSKCFCVSVLKTILTQLGDPIEIKRQVVCQIIGRFVILIQIIFD